MKIIINDHRKIFAVQEEFNNLFPYLRIEFFKRPSGLGASSPKTIMKHPAKTLGDCRITHTKGILGITPGMTVEEIEQNFRDVYGLSIQIFKREGKSWNAITNNYKWTLSEQNDNAKTLSSFISQKVTVAEN